MGNILTGRVIKVIDEYKVVINRGSAEGVSMSNRFLIYYLGEELFDPDSKDSLGILEIVCGEGRPIHIQEHITTLITNKEEKRTSKTVIKHNGYLAFGNNTTEETYDPETVLIPFEDVGEYCKFKQIK